MASSPVIAIRCDGSPTIGYGHVVRCLALAEELRRQGATCCFIMQAGTHGIQQVKSTGFRVLALSPQRSARAYGERFERLILRNRASAVVLDVRDNLPRATVQQLRSRGVMIVAIDDPTERRLDADIAFYPPVPQVARLSWLGFSGRLSSGWSWVVLRRQFARRYRTSRRSRRRPEILVAMGGSDPVGLTIKVVRAAKMLANEFTLSVMAGPGFMHDIALNRELEELKGRVVVHRAVSDVARLMRRCDMAVASFGVTAYELAACGAPAILLSLTPDHALSASAFAREKLAINLGVHRAVSVRRVAEAIGRLAADPAIRRRMAARCRRRIDGRGARRIAAVIMKRVGQVR